MFAHLDAELAQRAFFFGKRIGGQGHPLRVDLEVAPLHQQSAVDLAQARGRTTFLQRLVQFQHAQMFTFRLQELQRVGRIVRRDDDFDKPLGKQLRGLKVDRLCHRDDAAESRHRIARPRRLKRLRQIDAGGESARVRVFDDGHAGLSSQFTHRLQRGVRVEVIVVRHFLAVENVRPRDAGFHRFGIAVKHRLLMRVFAIAQFFPGGQGENKRSRRLDAAHMTAQVGGDGRVVAGLLRVYFLREFEAGGQCGIAVVRFDFRDDRGVVGRVGDDGHERVIFCRRTQHRRSANIDVFDRFFEGHVFLGDRLLKRVEVDAHEVDRIERVFLHRRHVLRIVAQMQQPGMHPRMQGFHPAVEHLGKTREVGHIPDRHPRRGQRLGGPAGGENFNAQ